MCGTSVTLCPEGALRGVPHVSHSTRRAHSMVLHGCRAPLRARAPWRYTDVTLRSRSALRRHVPDS
eukprot:5355310-Pyramimonas_sp.AAC.1